MHSNWAFLVLAGIAIACSSGGTSPSAATASGPGQQPASNPLAPAWNSQAPGGNPQAPAYNPQAPAFSCDQPATEANVWAAIGDAACDAAASCGQTVWTAPVDDQGAGGAEAATSQFWGLVCGLTRWCLANPAECESDDLVPQGDLGVCASQVEACYRAVVRVLGCNFDEDATEHLTMPTECVGVLGASEGDDGTTTPATGGTAGAYGY